MICIKDNELEQQSDALQANLEYYNKLGKPIVDEYSKDLDEKVDGIKNYLDQVKEYNLNFDIPSLQRMLVDLSTTIYYTSDKLEKLGLLEDMSKIKYKDKYNEAYLAKQGTSVVADKKYTVEQLKAHSDSEALTENVINFIYSHAASVLEAKIDSANELLKALSKILSSEITYLQTFGVSGKY